MEESLYFAVLFSFPIWKFFNDLSVSTALTEQPLRHNVFFISLHLKVFGLTALILIKIVFITYEKKFILI